jgi:hypothetical protein
LRATITDYRGCKNGYAALRDVKVRTDFISEASLD